MTFEAVADEIGLNWKTRVRYCYYMRQRWPDQESVDHFMHSSAVKWARRFAAGIEYAASDHQGKLVLHTMETLGVG